MRSVTLEIEGMHCEGCVQTIKALIALERGVRAVEVSYKDGQARILYDPKVIGENRLVRLIERGGYPVSAGKP